MVTTGNDRTAAVDAEFGHDARSMAGIASILSRLTDDEAAVTQALREIATIRRSDTHALSDLIDEVAQLRIALDSRISVEQAKGMLFANGAESLRSAFEVMRSHARSHNLTLHDVAAGVVSGTLGLSGDGAGDGSLVSGVLVAAGSPSPR